MWLDYAHENAAPESGKAYYVFAAPNGTPVRVEDVERNVVWRARSISPYGMVDLEPGASVELRLRFAGHFYDEHLELHYNRYRDYDPKLGRYLQPDPIGHDGGVNLYAYPSSPLVHVDLLGLVHRKGPKGKGEAQTRALEEAVAEDVAALNSSLTSNRQRKEHQMVSGVRNKRTGDMFTADNVDARAAKDAGELHPVVQRRIEAQGKVIDAHEELMAPPPKGQGKTTQEIHDMSDAEIRHALDKRGVPAEQDGMDTTEQMRRTNDRARFREESGDTDIHGGLRRENGNHGEAKATSDALNHVEKTENRPATGDDIQDLEIHNQRVPQKSGQPVDDAAMPRCENCQGITDGVEPTPALRDAETARDQRQENLWSSTES